ncbi:hypothetical protein PoB_003738100 [Plakobranchus ocellatus]|uniref:Uncharacterized protein n=1 Tax=Plakobranchus ocellatus TaxID=259542 RepID=A0AAV4AWG9_9GAST|nr:hypothetical protein PoB_003738100 [Plakobranchus ocellatus]
MMTYSTDARGTNNKLKPHRPCLKSIHTEYPPHPPQHPRQRADSPVALPDARAHEDSRRWRKQELVGPFGGAGAHAGSVA